MFHARFGRQRRNGFDRRSIKLLCAGWLPHVPLSDGAVLTLHNGCRIYPAHTGDATNGQPCLYVLRSGNFERYISDLIQATLGYFRK